jgi:hypothetical protein
MVGALRLLETGHQLAIDQLAAAVVQVMVVAVKGHHWLAPRLVVVLVLGPIVRLLGAGMNADNGQKGIDMAKKHGRRRFLRARSHGWPRLAGLQK